MRLAEAALVVGLALAVRLVFLDHTPHKDELNHVLAARSLIENGTLSIGGGEPYTRAWVYTYLVAALFKTFGESLVVARAPAVLFGAMLVLALFLWVHSEAGRPGAWLAALLLLFTPISLQMSQWVRFYTLHALLFFAACMLVYRAFADPIPALRHRIALGVAAVLSLGLALHFQITTVVGIAGLGLWAGGMAVREALRRITEKRHRRWLVAALGVAVTGFLAFLVFSGLLGWLGARASYVDGWAAANRDYFRYYHAHLIAQYPTLWTLFPLAVVLAVGYRPAAALLALSVFAVAFVAHSLAAWKSERYIFYILPMLFAIWGIALAPAIPFLWRRFRTLLARLAGKPLKKRIERVAACALATGVVLFAAAGNSAVSYSYKMLTLPDSEWGWPLYGFAPYRGEPDWVAAGHRLRPLLDDADAVLGSYPVSTLYGFGRIDYLLAQPDPRLRSFREFESTAKVPVPVVSRVESLRQVVACHRSGIVAVERYHWRDAVFLSDAVADYLEAELERVPLPEGWGLHVFRWSGEVDTTVDCSAVRSAR